MKNENLKQSMSEIFYLYKNKILKAVAQPVERNANIPDYSVFFLFL